MNEPLKIMVVDDTITYRLILKKAVSNIPDVEVAATAIHGEDALQKLTESPIDLVLLDIEMPRMDGLATMREIRKRHPNLGVVMISGANADSANMTIRALEEGALDFIPKPDGQDSQQNLEELRARLKPIIQATLARLGRKKNSPAQDLGKARNVSKLTPKPTVLLPSRFDAVVIGVSTGGPKALGEVVPKLPADLGVPVLIVQHMPPLFTASLANSLSNAAQIKVKEAVDGETVIPDQVYLAPGGRHMIVKRQQPGEPPQIGLNDDPPENSCRPAADVLFRSVAEVYGKNILVVVMTGMGSDGAKGVQTLKQSASCYCLTQSADSCVIYGMPKAVDDLELSDENVPLQNLAARITSLVKGGIALATTIEKR